MAQRLHVAEVYNFFRWSVEKNINDNMASKPSCIAFCSTKNDYPSKRFSSQLTITFIKFGGNVSYPYLSTCMQSKFSLLHELCGKFDPRA